MAAPARARDHMTVEQYLALPETMTRVDYVEGEVIVSPAPTPTHQEIALRLTLQLRSWAEKRPAPAPYVMGLPVDIRFATNRILQPDVCVWLPGLHRRRARPVLQIPELCIEVLSSDPSYDRVAKRLIYGEAGVREMWAVDPAGTVERWTGDHLGDWEAVEGTLRSALLPGFELDVASLFDALLGDEDDEA